MYPLSEEQIGCPRVVHQIYSPSLQPNLSKTLLHTLQKHLRGMSKPKVMNIVHTIKLAFFLCLASPILRHLLQY